MFSLVNVGRPRGRLTPKPFLTLAVFTLLTLALLPEQAELPLYPEKPTPAGTRARLTWPTLTAY